MIRVDVKVWSVVSLLDSKRRLAVQKNSLLSDQAI